MIDIRINIHCPDLVTAAGLLAGARTAPVPPQEAPKPSPIPAPAPAPQTAPVAPPAPQTAPVTPQPQGNVVQITTTTPPAAELPSELTQSHAPVAPTTGPSYTSADIARAGASRIQADPTGQMRATLKAMLQQHGIESAMNVPAELIPTVANELKALGAKL